MIIIPKQQSFITKNNNNKYEHILEDLRIHKLELEMQNEELRVANGIIQKAKDQYFKLYNLAPVGYFSLMNDGTILSVNKMGAKLLNKDISDILNKRFQLFLPEKSRIIFNEFYNLVHINDTIQHCELNIEIQEDIIHTFQIDGYKIKEKMQNFSIIYIALIDINQQKELDESQRRNTQLESFGLLAGGIAHDFNNILTTLQGNICLAQTSTDNADEMLFELNEMNKSIKRAKKLTDQLLTFSKGKNLITKLTNISNLVEDAVDFALSGSNIQKEINIKGEFQNAIIDEGQISQVIINIVRNAKESMKNGGTIKVNITNEFNMNSSLIPTQLGEFIKISIEDQGSGIPDNIKNKIYDPFFTTKIKGTGMGLSICFSIIKNHNGYIAFESKLNKGTKFFIFLPLSQEKIIETDSPPKNKFKVVRKKILLMDDDKKICSVMSKMLAKLGNTVVTSHNGEEALECYRKHLENGSKFDCAIIDLTIKGGMGGKDTIEHLRRFDPSIKAIVASGYSSDPVIKDFSNYGFDGILKKPYNIDDLRKALYQLFNPDSLINQQIR